MIRQKTARPTKNRDAQDRLMATQLILAVVVVAAVLLLSKMTPTGFETLSAQYTRFVTKPPVWQLEGVQNIFLPVIETIRGWFGNA